MYQVGMSIHGPKKHTVALYKYSNAPMLRTTTCRPVLVDSGGGGGLVRSGRSVLHPVSGIGNPACGLLLPSHLLVLATVLDDL